MDNTPKTNIENKISTSEAIPVKTPDKKAVASQRKVIEGVARTIGGMEFVESVPESAAEVTGEISEELAENKQGAPAAKMPTGSAATTSQFVTTKPPVIPPIEVVRRQVADAVRQRIKNLKEQAHKISHGPYTIEPFALNGLVAKIRALKEILTRIKHATFETLKSWWLEYVHGN